MRISTKREGFVGEAVGDGEPLVVERDIEIVRGALAAHAVVVLRGIDLAPSQQAALTRLLGEPEVVTDMRNHHPESLAPTPREDGAIPPNHVVGRTRRPSRTPVDRPYPLRPADGRACHC